MPRTPVLLGPREMENKRLTAAYNAVRDEYNTYKVNQVRNTAPIAPFVSCFPPSVQGMGSGGAVPPHPAPAQSDIYEYLSRTIDEQKGSIASLETRVEELRTRKNELEDELGPSGRGGDCKPGGSDR